MRRTVFLLSILGLAGLTASFSLLADHPIWRGKTLSAEETAKRWGKTELDIERFKNGDEKIRASMAYSLLQNKPKFTEKFVTEIRALFGNPDGFYFKDVFPAYIIQTAKTHEQETWQIVFVLNSQRHVKDIIVHKNCCN